MLIDALPTYFLLLTLGLLASLQSASGIKCYVCAPVPEIGQTCTTPTNDELEDCEPRHDYCHALFIQDASGNTEITRNCGRFKGAFQAGANECKDFTTSNQKTVRLCNCQSDRCNDQQVPSSMSTPPTAAPLTTPAPIRTTELYTYRAPQQETSTKKSSASSLQTLLPLLCFVVFISFLSKRLF